MKPLVSMDCFNRPPLKLIINGREVSYLNFSRPKTCHKSPIVFLGGAFQKFHSFKKDVELLSDVHPILLVELPGFGSNSDTGSDLSFEDLADILCQFMDQMGIEKITPVASSFASAIAFFYASKYPDRTEKLILGGTTPKVRESIRLLLEESLVSVNEGKIEEFSAGIVLNLINFYRRHEIKGSQLMQQGLYRNMMKLEAIELCRYEACTKRLLSLEKLPDGPVCETLVLVGEYDNFTTPAECFEVARMCQKSTFGILKNADHLSTCENKKLTSKLYKKFLAGVPINGTSGVKVFNRAEYPVMIQRLEPRYDVDDLTIIEGSGSFFPVNIVNISTAGVMLNKSMSGDLPIGSRNLKIRLPYKELEMELFLVDDREETVRGIFKRYNFGQCKELEEFVRFIAVQSNGFCDAA